MRITTQGKTIETTRSIWLDYEDSPSVHFIDQRYIPFKVEILTSKKPEMTAEFIQKMVIRGAPAIGAAAAYGMVQSAKVHENIPDFTIKKEKMRLDAKLLLKSRPTAVDLKNVLLEMDKVIEKMEQYSKEQFTEEIKKKAETIVDGIINECKLLANTGYGLLQDGMNILHHCNTGPLATVDIGSALGVIIEAHKKGKNIHVYVDETRPRLQGGRLTTWELQQANVSHTLIADTVGATLMKQGKIDIILVGADRIVGNGDFANKIGTYNLAVLAQYHNVPMYTVAPWSTFDFSIESGEGIIVEERSPEEVTHAFTEDLQMKQISNESNVFNPAFDVTPHELLTGIIAPGIIIKPPFTKTIPEALRNVKK